MKPRNSRCCGSKMGSFMPSADWDRIPSRQWTWQTLFNRLCMPIAAIETEGLRKVFGDHAAVEALTLQVAQGEVFGFLGPNGAGKTTSIKMLLGLVAPTSGSASLLGAPIGDRGTLARVGFLPEHFRFHDWLTAGEFLGFHGELLGMEGQAL